MNKVKTIVSCGKKKTMMKRKKKTLCYCLTYQVIRSSLSRTNISVPSLLVSSDDFGLV